ncbi:DUF1481 domain-containing protein [Salmonella enterica subsp. enterica]|nr:DUF1481 domain-containing protein [Salmonella enterica subsp. enterica]
MLSLIELNIYNKPPEHIRARFGAHSELSFMQREVGGRSSSFCDPVRCIAIAPNKSVRPATPCALGRVILRQGRQHADHTVTTCEGETLKPDLDSGQ